jgi:hypothetical protein
MPLLVMVLNGDLQFGLLSVNAEFVAVWSDQFVASASVWAGV